MVFPNEGNTESALRHSVEVMRYIIKYDPDAIAVYDKDLHYIAVSDRYLEDYNVKEENVIGKHHYEVFPEMPQRWKEVHQRVLAGAIERNDDDYFERPDGSITYNRWECRPWYQSDGSIGGMITYTEVTTERKLVENALRESEKKYRDLYEKMMDGFAITDMNGKIIQFNKAFEALLGYTEEELYDLNVTEITPEKWHVFEKWIINEQVLKRGYSDVYEKEYRRKDGSVFPIELRATLMKNGKNENIGMWAIVRDISERKKTEAEIQRLNENLEAEVEKRTSDLAIANKELEAFSYSVSHDLRAPLRAMDGFSLAILEDYGNSLEPQGRDYLERIREASQKMASLIDAMLTLSKVTQASLHLTDVNFSTLAENIYHDLKMDNDMRDIEFIVQPDIAVVADPVLLRSALENLIGNALKFTSKKPTARIEIGRIIQDGEEVYFVKDDGAGFDMKFATRLFTAFQRMHSSAEFEGTGIGLATVYRIISKHGGRIWAEGKPQEGATFYFTLTRV